MTLDHAIEKVCTVLKPNYEYGRIGPVRDTVRVILLTMEAMGTMPPFEAPKTEDELLLEAMRAAWAAAGNKDATAGPLAMIEALNDHNFCVSRSPRGSAS